MRVATLGVGLPASCLVASQAHARYRWHLDSASLYECRVLWFPWGHKSSVFFATTGVAMLGVDLPASCLVPALSSYTLYVEPFDGVSTFGIGL
jgi:hypothetical protein